MSDAQTPKPDSSDAVVAIPLAITEQATVQAAGASKHLAGVALVTALVALGGAGYALWGQLQAKPDVATTVEQLIQGPLAQLKSQDSQLLAHLQRVDTQLASSAQQEATLKALQIEQGAIAQRLAVLNDGGQAVLRLVEAEHLLRLASLRLAAMEDVPSAIALIEGADGILLEQNDPSAYAARQALARSLAHLRSLQFPDRTGLFLELAALRDQALALQVLVTEFVPAKTETDQSGVGYWQAWWDKISSFVRIDVNANQNIQPLLAGQQLSQVRFALSLAIEQAQWAVLQGEEAVYRQALTQAQQILHAHFNQNEQANRSLYERFTALAERPVSVQLPVITDSLAALQAYLKLRQSAGAETAPLPTQAAPESVQ